MEKLVAAIMVAIFALTGIIGVLALTFIAIYVQKTTGNMFLCVVLILIDAVAAFVWSVILANIKDLSSNF